jgi:1-aminocyclopropane-1-carboxylate deaminase/D-cysteine desulfhydrase-like pyridoxal-dependent ACC family enzyme
LNNVLPYPRIKLLEKPTPVRRLVADSGRCDAPQYWVKLDGHASSGLGGTKLRNLEFILADAIQSGAKTLSVLGKTTANFPYLAARSAVTLGLSVELLLSGSATAACDLPSCKVRAVNDPKVVVKRISAPSLCARNWLARQSGSCRSDHRRSWCYRVPIGGASPIGCLGGVLAFNELSDQVTDGSVSPPTRIVVPGGSGGLAAGLLAGVYLSRSAPIEINVVASSWSLSARMIRDLARATVDLVDPKWRSSKQSRTRFASCADYLSVGRPTASLDVDAAVQDAHLEHGLQLDRMYTGPLYGAHRRLAKAGDVVLLWITCPSWNND